MQSALNFLTRIEANNNRDWFQAHKDEYEQSREEFIKLVGEVLAGTAAFEPHLAGLEAKNCVFRIYRDVRFSKDKRPYKTHFGAWLADVNKNLVVPGYYIHLQPGASFLAAGLWMPPADELKKIRQEIDYNGAQLHQITQNADFQQFFAGLSTEESLKTTPKGYMADHPDIAWLRLKSFTVSCPASDKQAAAKSFASHCVAVFKAAQPFNHFLRTAIA